MSEKGVEGNKATKEGRAEDGGKELQNYYLCDGDGRPLDGRHFISSFPLMGTTWGDVGTGSNEDSVRSSKSEIKNILVTNKYKKLYYEISDISWSIIIYLKEIS